jgi:hypothetical protein
MGCAGVAIANHQNGVGFHIGRPSQLVDGLSTRVTRARGYTPLCQDGGNEGGGRLLLLGTW